MILWHTFRLYHCSKNLFRTLPLRILQVDSYSKKAIFGQTAGTTERELIKENKMFILLSILFLWLFGNIRIIDMRDNPNNQHDYRSYDYQPPPQPKQPTYGMQQAYTTLGLTASATDDEIKKAYRRMAMQYHPDRQINASETEQKWAAEKFRAVQKAYEHIKQQRNIK